MNGGLSALQTISNALMMEAAIKSSREDEEDEDCIIIEIGRREKSKKWSLIEWLKSLKKS